MIETPVLDAMDAEDVLSLASSAHRQMVESDALILRLAAQWTDRYNADALQKRPAPTDDSGEVLPGMERAKQFGGDGTPKVLEFAPAEFGITLEMSTGQAAAMIADVLDLRHRLPKLWARVGALQVAGWKARAVAHATRHLSLEDCLTVDEAIAESITRLSWSRFKTKLDGEIIKANPEEAQQRADSAERDRFVRTGRSNEYGLKTIYARAAAGDVLWLDATIDRLARIMAASGDVDALDVRRSKALGILANPILAAGMLAEAEGLDLSDPAEDEEDPDDDGSPRDGRWVPSSRKEWVREGTEEPSADPDLEPTLPDDPENPAAPEDSTAAGDPAAADDLDPADPADAAAADCPGDPDAAHDHSADGVGTDDLDPEDPGLRGESENGDLHDRDRGHPRNEEPQENSARNTDTADLPGPESDLGPDDHEPDPESSKNGSQDEENAQRPDLNVKGEVCPQCGTAASDAPADSEPDGTAWWGPKPTADHQSANQGTAYRTIRARAAKAGLTALAQAGVNPDKALPKVVLYAHVAAETLTDTNGVIRIDGVGPATLEHLRRHLGSHARIILKPVIDLNNQPAPVDAYEIPSVLREQIRLRQIGDQFPFATAGDTHQLDHTNAYLNMLRGGRPGQTAIENLALLKLISHRLKTHGGFQCLQPRPGTLIWRTPHGYICINDHTGTHHLGNDTYTQAIWEASGRINAEADTESSPTTIRVDYAWHDGELHDLDLAS